MCVSMCTLIILLLFSILRANQMYIYMRYDDSLENDSGNILKGVNLGTYQLT